MHNYTSQSQTEYKSIFSPFDAETVQGKMRLNPQTSEGLHRINAMINHWLGCRGTLNPHNAVVELRYKLNHLNLDFPIGTHTPIENTNTFEVTHGMVFGVTPQTDLSQGFDTGSDLPKYNLTINVGRDEHGFKLSGKLEPKDSQISEAVEHKIKSKKRINTIKEMLKNKKKKNKKK